MKVQRVFLPATAALAILIFSAQASAQYHTYVPESSQLQPPDQQGNRMFHTNIRIVVPNGTQKTFGEQAAQPAELPPFAGYLYETPASIGCIYGLTYRASGCNPNINTVNPGGGSKAIAVVDAFDDPTAVSDAAVFSMQFGLPSADLTVVFADGTRPGVDPTGGWEIEEALDVQWAHAMAPHARIFLVESADNSDVNLFNAVTVASKLVAAAGGGEVSMSWGGGEFSLETAFDSVMTRAGVVYFASAGDGPGTIYPSASPNVISAGGTSITRDLANGDFLLEDAWQDGGGGPSAFEPRPAFQNGVKNVVGAARGTPDLSFDSNPTSGVWVYDTNAALGTGWYVVGGTSVAAPSLSGIINSAGKFRASSRAENTVIYDNLGNAADYTDIFYGNCGPYNDYFTSAGYDLCTGVGSPYGRKGK